MNKLKVRFKSHLYFLSSALKVKIDDLDMGEIGEGVIKAYDINHKTPIIRVKGLVNELTLTLDLNKDSYFELTQTFLFGMIRVEDPEKIIIDKKNTINWKIYLIMMSITFSLIALLIILLIQINS